MRLSTSLRTVLKQGLLSLGYPTARLARTDATLVLFYHAICDAGISVLEFEKQLRYLKAHFELIFASEIGKPNPSGNLRVAITFDDGLKNTRDVALPILEKLGIKATLFALPCDIRWLWPAEIRERLTTALNAGLALDGLTLRDENDIDHLVEELKTLPEKAFDARIEHIRSMTPFEPSSDWRAIHELMAPDELRTLPEDLIEIGAHTLRHPILPKLEDARLHSEIVQVKQQLETLLGRPVKTFSYPNGDFDRRCLDFAEQHYEFAFTTETAIGDYPDQADIRGHRHAVNRLHGAEHQADLPLKMNRFIKQGYGFGSVESVLSNRRPRAGEKAQSISTGNPLSAADG